MRGRIALPLLALCLAALPALAKRKPAQSGATAAFSVTSRIVVLDVVVLNHGKPVCGLKKQDFRILEDRRQQPVDFFQNHCGHARHENAGQAMPAASPLPPHTYDNLPITRATDSVTVLLLDGLNTQVADSQYLRLQMIQYLKNLPAGRRIAIFALGSKLRMLQGFTTDPRMLLAAISGPQATAPGSLVPAANHIMTERAELDTLEAAHVPPDTIMAMQDFMSDSDTQETSMRVGMTLQALQEMGRYLGGIPGRKNLIWFSGSFPLDFYSDVETPALNTYIVNTGSFQDRLKATAALLAAARVAVYPVDVRGLLMDPMFDAEQPGENGDPLRFAHDTKMADLQRIEEHGTMNVLAKETGGRAVYESNALQAAVADALSDGDNFYTVAYRPQNARFNGAWRKIKVSLDANAATGKYTLLYRDGYYATNGMLAEQTGDTGARQVFGAAMEDGIPPSSQILFKARVVAPDGHAPFGPILGQNQNLKDPVARYVIDYAISLEHVHLAVSPQGVHAGRLLVEAMAYSDDGKTVNWISNMAPIELAPAAWRTFAEDGLQFHQVLDLPKGTIQLRLGIYDPASGNLGTLEIPLQVGAQKPGATAEARR